MDPRGFSKHRSAGSPDGSEVGRAAVPTLGVTRRKEDATLGRTGDLGTRGRGERGFATRLGPMRFFAHGARRAQGQANES